MQANRNTHLCQEKTPNYNKAPNTKQTCGYREIQGNPVNFFNGVDFSSRNNFGNLGSFAKASVPVASIIP